MKVTIYEKNKKHIVKNIHKVEYYDDHYRFIDYDHRVVKRDSNNIDKIELTNK